MRAAYRNSAFWTQQDGCACQVTETVAAHTHHTGSSLTGSSTERREWTCNPAPNQEAICNWHYWQRDSHFSPVKCHWEYQPHSRAGPMPSTNWPTQNELNDVFVDSLFHSALPWRLATYWSFICLDFHFCDICCCCCCLLAFVFVFLREHEVERVGLFRGVAMGEEKRSNYIVWKKVFSKTM